MFRLRGGRRPAPVMRDRGAKKHAAAQTLYDLVLAGTHDSAAYHSRPDLLARTAPPLMAVGVVRAITSRTQSEFALTQTLTVRQQLEAGARFLDLRVSKRAGTPEHVDEFWTVHGMVLCVPLDEVVAQLNEFERDRPKPRDAPVVLAVRYYQLSANEAHALGKYLLNHLKGGVFVGDSMALARIPLRELPSFVLAGVAPSLLSTDWGADVWTDTYCSTRKIEFLEDALDGVKMKRSREPSALFVLGWTVTPNAVDVALRFISWGVLRRTVMEEAVDMNCLFEQFVRGRGKDLREKANVVFFDCFSEREARLVAGIAKRLDESDKATA